MLSDECIADEVPFDLPEGWAWARLESVSTHIVDGDHNPPKNSGSGIPIYSATNIHDGKLNMNEAQRWITEEQYLKHCKRLMARKGCVLLTIVGTIGRTAVVTDNVPFALQRSVCVIGAINLNPNYLSLFLESAAAYLQSISSGTAQQGVYLGTISSLLIPVPPLAEQQRIVKCVSELMPHIEEYGELEDARENLDVALPEQLRKSILQQAVQGKLVAQDPADEPASILLEHIHEQRHQLIAEGKVKFPKGGESVIYTDSDGRHYEKRIDAKGRVLSDECIEDEIPFEIPNSWSWARLESVTHIASGYAFKSHEYKQTGTRIIRISDFDEKGFINNNIVRYEYDDSLSPFLLSESDILMCMTGGTVGKSLYVRHLAEPMLVNQRVAIIRRPDNLNSSYLHLVITSNHIHTKIAQSKNSTNDNISMTTIAGFLIPVPPLPEQQRIVNAVNGFDSILK